MSRQVALSSADYTLIHCVGAIGASSWNVPETTGMLIDVLRRVLPSVNRTIPDVGRFAEIAEKLIAAANDPSALAELRTWDAAGAVRDWHMRRAGEAWEIFKQGGQRHA